MIGVMLQISGTLPELTVFKILDFFFFSQIEGNPIFILRFKAHEAYPWGREEILTLSV